MSRSLTEPQLAPGSSATVRIEGLTAEYRTRLGVTRALDGVDLTVEPGELLAIVGESGSGKSTISQAIGRMLPRVCHITEGSVRVLDQDLATLAPDDIRTLVIPVFAHRILLAGASRRKSASVPAILNTIVEQVPVPVEAWEKTEK